MNDITLSNPAPPPPAPPPAKGISFRNAFSYHFSSLLFHGSHFFPYSILAYPVIALMRPAVARLDRIWKFQIWLLYFVAVFLFNNNSYFFRYEYAWRVNPFYFSVCAAIGAWTLISSVSRFNPIAVFTPYFSLIAYNISTTGSYPFGWRFTNGHPGYTISFIIFALLVLWKYRLNKGLFLLIISAGLFLYTGNGPYPFITMAIAVLVPLWAFRTGAIRAFNPPVLAVSTFHLLLIAGFSVFYSNSLPHAIDNMPPPRSIMPVYIYGSEKKGFPQLSIRDNRFLSIEPRKRFIFFGSRMSFPHLNRINLVDMRKISALTILNTSDNAVFDPQGKWLAVGSTKRKTIDLVDIDPMRFVKSKTVPFSPIRLLHDPIHKEIYTIGEFGSGELAVLDDQSLKNKRSYHGKQIGGTNFRDFALDPAEQRIAILRWTDLELYNSKTLKKTDGVFTGNRGLGRLSIDTKRKIIYLTHTQKGLLLGYSYKNDKLKKVAQVALGGGIRDVDFDPINNCIATANYFSGTLSLYSLNKSKILFRVNLGPRMRHVEFSQDGRLITTTTIAGGFIVNIPETEKAYENNRKIRPTLLSYIDRALRMISHPRYFSV